MSGDAIVVGGGVVGLACAWAAARRGVEVTVVDEGRDAGAWRVAAGMLTPVTEVVYGEQELLALTIASSRRWPDFARELEEAAARPVGYRSHGTLLVGAEADDVRVLDALLAFQRELGLEVERLRSRDCREREPLLSPRVRGGLFAPGDHQVDPRRVVAALEVAAEAAGVHSRRGRATEVIHDGTRVRGVRLDDGAELEAARVVLAAGSWSGHVGGLPAPVRPPVRPVKGQLLVLRARERAPVPGLTVRGVVAGRSVYLVPREDGRVIVGATQEERGFDTRVTAGALRTLLDDAARVVPGVDELELVEAMAGLRPGTPDNRPLIGPTSLEGLLLATGHHRHGILLTPVTADAVAAWLTGTEPPEGIGVADPRRTAVATSGSPG